jgi:hypothetical protein
MDVFPFFWIFRPSAEEAKGLKSFAVFDFSHGQVGGIAVATALAIGFSKRSIEFLRPQCNSLLIRLNAQKPLLAVSHLTQERKAK